MGALSIRAAGPNDAEALFAIHRESAMTAYVEIFPPDRYRFPDAEMREVWARALRGGDTSALIAERACTDIRHWSEPGRGGHFMPLEEPDLLAGELRQFFTSLRP